MRLSWSTALKPLLLILTTCCLAQAATSPGRLLEISGVKGGVAVHLGCAEGRLTAGLCSGRALLVHGLDTDAATVERARKHIDSLGLYGQVSAEVYDGRNLPHGDNIVNLLVHEDAASVSAKEIERVLVPKGVALVKSGLPGLDSPGLRREGEAAGWTKYVKPWPESLDEWTHFLYDASNNAVSRDMKVGLPRRVQWWAGPEHTRHHDAMASMSAMTSSGGRVFYIYDEGPVSVVHQPPDWKLIARDAFNGKLLWKRDIPDWMTHLYNFRAGPVQLQRRLVSVGEHVYVTLGFTAPVVKLDAATGETLHTYAGSRGAEEILWHDGTLMVVTGDASKLVDEADACHGYWELTENEEEVAKRATVEKAVVAYDADGGRELWRVTGDHLKRLAPLSLTAEGGRIFYLDGKELHCLDAKTGRERWASNFETEGLFIRAYAPTVVVSDGVIMCLTWDRLFGWSVEDGRKLWENKGAIGFGSPGDLFAIDGKVWTAPMMKSIWRESRRNRDGVITTGVNIPKSDFLNDAKTAVGIDIRTGKVTDLLPFVHNQHHHRCYRNKATERYLLIGHSGIQVLDPKTKKSSTNQWVRGLCQYGIMPANGCIYVPPDPCQCYGAVKINGFFALAERNSMDEIEIAPAVVRGPAFARVSGRRDEGSILDGASSKGGVVRYRDTDAWPTYRGGVSRSGSTECAVPARPRVKWEAEIGESVTAPVVAGERVFVAERDAYTLHCLDRKSGRPAWRFFANGPVDTPPTIYKGLCVFGCGDGSVYCLDAETGELAWRFKTSAIERRIGSENRIESPHRVHGAVLVQGNTVYFAAGRSSFLDGGIRVYGVDVWTGRQLHERTLASQHGTKSGSLSDVLVSTGDAISMRQVRFGTDLKGGGRGGGLVASTGLLDTTWFHRQGWSLGKLRGQLVVQGKSGTYSVINPYTGLKKRRKGQFRQFNQVGHLHIKFTRYKEEYFPVGTTIAARGPGGRGGGGGTWSIGEKLQPRAMILAGDHLLLAGRTDEFAIELKSGRARGAGARDDLRPVLRAYAAKSGKRVSETTLGSAPVFDGLAAAYGDVFVSLENGKLVCLGE
ncbi:MAG: outer membrane protein assembly factor BamB family protein [Planctomycetota bacterium]|jgi:outer membrane protein assembly factor BamB